jgi:hypothetical protein
MTFQDDVDFLKRYTEVDILSMNESCHIIVSPRLQGRVLTSTFNGLDGTGLGWINYELLKSGAVLSHCNAYGGEDRFWMGPEAGQFGLNFTPGTPFDLEHAYVPDPFDKEPFEVIKKDKASITFQKETRVQNYSGSKFHINLNRNIRFLNLDNIFPDLKLNQYRVKGVGFESINRVKNSGNQSWTSQTGLISIWILGMFPASDQSRVVIPLNKVINSNQKRAINDSYFGKISTHRLKVSDSVVIFKADGKLRSKIGVAPAYAQPIFGVWDASRKIITIIKYSLPKPLKLYVNSMWEIQEKPFEGDVINSYNDGPDDGIESNSSTFFELETSSPALDLNPGESWEHIHQTIHLSGDGEALDRIFKNIFDISISQIESFM